MDIRLAYSPCPNDTFIFYALIHKKIDTGKYNFQVELADVEELNRKAMEGEIDLTKLSYHAFAYVSDSYRILDSGSALGRGNGPILVSRRKIYPDEVPDLKIAIPGERTTAYLLLRIAYPRLKEVKAYLFSDIEDVVASDEMDAGLIIHENRFTYQKKGLKKVLDLGDYWEKKSGAAIPLGGIVVNRKLPSEVQQDLNALMHESVKYALDYPEKPMGYVKQYAQNMDPEVMKMHIRMFVNEFTRELGAEGKESIRKLLNTASDAGIFPKPSDDIFIS